MSTEHAMFERKQGAYVKDDAQLAAWLGLLSFTFFSGTFVAANVYLRGWNPDKFTLKLTGFAANLPYIAMLSLLVAAVLILIGGTFFKKRQYGKFQATLALSAIPLVAYGVMEAWMVVISIQQSVQAATIYATVDGLNVIVAAVAVAMLMAMGWKYSARNEEALIRLVPTAMTVIMYAVLLGLAILLITNVATVGGFMDWCGIPITQK